MKSKKNVRTMLRGLVVSAVLTLLLAPSAGAASHYKVLYRFKGGNDGMQPTGLIFDAAGNLLGTTESGGTFSHGSVFQLMPNGDGSWTESVLYSFQGGTDGAFPQAGLISDQAGNLYGTAGFGGNMNQGAVFELTPHRDGSWTESVLYSFCSTTSCNDGSGPLASLISDPAGNLYGTTRFGGTYGVGTVFQLTRNGGNWTESVLLSFPGVSGRGGAEPLAGLIFDSAGSLYGTTAEGGYYKKCDPRCGVVFRLTPKADGSWTETVLSRFRGGASGALPLAGLVFDATGNLYGTTFRGGDISACGGFGCGVAFELEHEADGSWKEKVLHQFKGKDGADPASGLTFDRSGNLYGTTESGGDLNFCQGSGCGVVFRLAPNSSGGWSETRVHTFGGVFGGPAAGVIFDAAGNLYGTTIGGNGTVYEITP